jgi:hypothetical protein
MSPSDSAGSTAEGKLRISPAASTQEPCAAIITLDKAETLNHRAHGAIQKKDPFV